MPKQVKSKNTISAEYDRIGSGLVVIARKIASGRVTRAEKKKYTALIIAAGTRAQADIDEFTNSFSRGPSVLANAIAKDAQIAPFMAKITKIGLLAATLQKTITASDGSSIRNKYASDSKDLDKMEETLEEMQDDIEDNNDDIEDNDDDIEDNDDDIEDNDDDIEDNAGKTKITSARKIIASRKDQTVSEGLFDMGGQ